MSLCVCVYVCLLECVHMAPAQNVARKLLDSKVSRVWMLDNTI
jgi:hypothetical protein